MAKSPKKLDELFHDTLKDIYFAEKKILSTLPKMARAAHSEELRAAFEKHRQETEGHVARLEQVFAAINQKPQGKTCAAIVGITAEGAEHGGIQGLACSRCRTSRGCTGRRTLRNLPLRHASHLGRRVGTQEGGDIA